MKYDPKKDGVDHINMYSKAKTELGRKLTNFAHTPFEHPTLGHFESVEGLWYFLKTGRLYEKFRELHGFAAKKEGRRIFKGVGFGDNDSQGLSENFKNNIIEGIKAKFKDNPDILRELCLSSLPLAHYYYFGDDRSGYTIKTLEEYDWITEAIESLRSLTQKHWIDKGYIDENLNVLKKNSKKVRLK